MVGDLTVWKEGTCISFMNVFDSLKSFTIIYIHKLNFHPSRWTPWTSYQFITVTDIEFYSVKKIIIKTSTCTFSDSLILWGMDFTNEEQYSSSIKFQYSCISVDKSALQDGHGPFSTINIQLDLDQSCLLTMSLCFYVILKRNFNTTCSMARCIIILINVVIITNLLLIDWMRKVSKISAYSCALTEDVMTAVFPGPLPDNQRHIINKICTFPSGCHLSIFHWNWTKQVSASSLCPMQICDSSLSNTFIQSSTVHDCFSLNQIKPNQIKFYL